jgi:hypothetical protein
MQQYSVFQPGLKKDALQEKLPGGLSKGLKRKKRRKVPVRGFTSFVAFLPVGCF